MQSLSCVSPTYMSFQFDINQKMRAILIDWLIEVYEFSFGLVLLKGKYENALRKSISIWNKSV